MRFSRQDIFSLRGQNANSQGYMNNEHIHERSDRLFHKNICTVNDGIIIQ